MVSSQPTDGTRCSKIYVGEPYLDFRLDKVHDVLIFKKMRCLNYTSSLDKGSEEDILRHLDPEGGPDRLSWITEDLELSPNTHKGRHEIYFFLYKDDLILIMPTPGFTPGNLMIALTGWNLVFAEDASSVVVKARARLPAKIKRALVTVWEKGSKSGRDVHLLVRASDARERSESTTWLGTSRKWIPVWKFNGAFLCGYRHPRTTHAVHF